MFTLSIAMAARHYVVCFDLGAQAERLKAWGWGRTLPLTATPQAINKSLLAAATWLESRPVAPAPPAAATYPDLLSSYYGFTVFELERMGLVPRKAPALPTAIHNKDVKCISLQV
jgi:O-antigen biosynthesis protein